MCILGVHTVSFCVFGEYSLIHCILPRCTVLFCIFGEYPNWISGWRQTSFQVFGTSTQFHSTYMTKANGFILRMWQFHSAYSAPKLAQLSRRKIFPSFQPPCCRFKRYTIWKSSMFLKTDPRTTRKLINLLWLNKNNFFFSAYRANKLQIKISQRICSYIQK
jgi:hypothetical protein